MHFGHFRDSQVRVKGSIIRIKLFLVETLKVLGDHDDQTTTNDDVTIPGHFPYSMPTEAQGSSSQALGRGRPRARGRTVTQPV